MVYTTCDLVRVRLYTSLFTYGCKIASTVQRINLAISEFFAEEMLSRYIGILFVILVLLDIAIGKSLPSSKQTAKPHKLDVEIPIYHRPDVAERPANCPKSQMSEIIKACTDECKKDSECPSRRKCCWNGCARRCTKPLIKDPTNYLNLPLLTNDD
uniref:WAP domain-containing protein n=1 Tax=Bursaphelenchus xylophilus TaxID=6326 RepID=A0A1I7RXX0_BURXY